MVIPWTRVTQKRVFGCVTFKTFCTFYVLGRHWNGRLTSFSEYQNQGHEPYLFSVLKCKKGNNLGEKIETSKASDHRVGLSPDHISSKAFRDSTGHLALFAYVNIYPLKFIEGSVERTLVIILMNSSHPDVREQTDKWKKSVCDTAK